MAYKNAGCAESQSKQMTVDLVFITFNRLEYTKLALSSVLADPKENFSLTIWDNASTDGTVEYLRNEVNDSRIADIVFSKKNIGQTQAVNKIWSHSRADLLGKLDNDCILTPGWTCILAQAHQDIEKLGVVACWHFPLEDFDENAARKAGKIQRFGNHQIFRHPWTCGTGLLLKRTVFEKFGPIKEKDTTKYWLKIALKGYINGFYYPLVLQEHMDDPKSSHCLLKDDESIQKMRDVTFILREHNINSMKERWERREFVLKNLFYDPPEARYYAGSRVKFRRGVKKIVRILGKLKKSHE
jgi:glycosyltransferase involved in cell wall biosynthesis